LEKRKKERRGEKHNLTTLIAMARGKKEELGFDGAAPSLTEKKRVSLMNLFQIRVEKRNRSLWQWENKREATPSRKEMPFFLKKGGIMSTLGGSEKRKRISLNSEQIVSLPEGRKRREGRRDN